MNLFSVLSLVAMCIYFMIGLFSFLVYKNSKIRGLFLTFCMSMAIWSFAYAFVYVSSINNGFWMKLSAVGWCTFDALLLHMSIKITDCKMIRYPLRMSIIYLPALLFLYMDVFLFWPNHQPSAAVQNFFYTGDFVYNFSYLAISMILIHRWGHRTGAGPIRKKQSLVVLATSLIPFLLQLLMQDFLPMIGVQSLPPGGQLYMLILMLGIFWSSTRYALFDIPYKVIFEEMLPEMMDMFFLLDPEGVITSVNSRTESLLKYQKEELIGCKMESLFNAAEKITPFWECIDTASDRDRDRDRPRQEVELVKKNGERIPVELSCSTVYGGTEKRILGRVIIGQDITIQKTLEHEFKIQLETEEELRASEERFRVIFTKHSSMMLLTDPVTLKIYMANEAAQNFYGYNEEEFEMLTMTDINNREYEEERSIINRILENELHLTAQQHRLATGETRDVEIHSAPVSFKEKLLIFSIIHDITERKKEEDRIIHLAYHDGLTDLFNHKFFYERLRMETARAERYHDRFGVMYIDMNKFKEINDNYGHNTGDLVLIEVGRRIKNCIRETDIAARIGGDEFALILLDIKGGEEVRTISDKLIQAFQKPILVPEGALAISASIGCSIYPEDGGNADHLIRAADREMYLMKNKRQE